MKFKVIATIIMVVVLMQFDGFAFFLLAVLFAVAALLIWKEPARAAHGDRSPGPEFQAAFKHDYIALDTTNRRLWIRDPKRGNRYLQPEDIKMIRTAFDETRPGRIHQRIEVEIDDLEHPVWHVWFERHPESRIKGSNRNKEERDEWFARVKTWAQMKNLP